MTKIKENHRGYIRLLSFFMANRTLCPEILKDVDYSQLFTSASFFEQAMAIYCNVLDTDELGNEISPGHAERRTAQYIRSLYDSDYTVEPPFSDEEMELHL